jgi:hypothetical protein
MKDIHGNELKAFSRKTDEEIYMEWVNDWLTISAMAKNYGRSYDWMYNRVMKAKENYETKIMQL